MRHKVKYAPKPDSKAFAPDLRPGEVINVSKDEAKRLIETGAFEPVKDEKKSKKGGTK